MKKKQSSRVKAAEARGGRMANVEEGHRRSMSSGTGRKESRRMKKAMKGK